MTRYANSQTNTITHPVGNYWENSNQSTTNTTAEMTLVAKQNCIFTVSGTLNHTGSTFNVLLNGTNMYTNNTAGTSVAVNKSLDVPQNATVKIQFVRGTNTGTTYNYTAQLVLKSVNANVYNSITTLKDVVHGLRTDQSTSISTGALTLAGGLGVAKNINGGGNLSIAGDTSFTGGVFKTQDYIGGSGSWNTINDSNINTYFTVNNDTNNPWIAPGQTYTLPIWTTSGSAANITSSNVGTYFTTAITPTGSGGNSAAQAWTYNSTEGAYYAGQTAAPSTTLYWDMTFTATQSCVITAATYKRSAYSGSNFYWYYQPAATTGNSWTQLGYYTNTYNSTSYINAFTSYSGPWHLNAGDKIRIYFYRNTTSTSGYTYDCYFKMSVQAASWVDTELTNGAYWLNTNSPDTKINTTSKLILTAKQNCLVTLTSSGSNTTGDTVTYYKNNNTITTTTDIQMWTNDMLEIRYARSSHTYNFYKTELHELHLVIQEQAGTTGKEVVTTGQNRFISSVDATSPITGALQVTGGVGTNTLYANWNKGNYLRIDSTNTDTAIRTLLNGRSDLTGNVNIGTGTVQFTGNGSKVFVTSDNLATWFTVTNESYYFTPAASDSDYWTSNNNAASTYTYARTEFTAVQNCILDFTIKLNGTSSDSFTIYLDGTSKYTKTSINSTTFSATYTLNVQSGQKVKLEFYKYSSSSSYTHQAQIQIQAQTATTSTTTTAMKDVTSFTDTTQSTSTTTGAVKLSGGLGIAKNVNIGGALTNTGDASFTNGTFITEDYLSATGTATTLSTLANLQSYFTVTNDSTYPFLAPNATYTAKTYTTSDTVNNITSSNLATYFTATNPANRINDTTTTTYAWTYDSTEGAYFAGNTSGTGDTSKYYIMNLTAKQDCQITIQYKKHAQSSDQFYVYYWKNGTNPSANAIMSNTSNATQTSYQSAVTCKLQNGDTIQLYFYRGTGTTATYNHNIYVKLTEQAITTTNTSATNGAYWTNGNFDKDAAGKTAKLILQAKQTCVIGLNGSSSVINGDSYYIYRNGTQVVTNWTRSNVQLWTNDILELRFTRETITYNGSSKWNSVDHQGHVVITYQAGTLAKEIILNGKTYIRNEAIVYNISPATTATYNLGTSSNKWSNIYTQNLYTTNGYFNIGNTNYTHQLYSDYTDTAANLISYLPKKTGRLVTIGSQSTAVGTSIY